MISIIQTVIDADFGKAFQCTTFVIAVVQVMHMCIVEHQIVDTDTKLLGDAPTSTVLVTIYLNKTWRKALQRKAIWKRSTSSYARQCMIETEKKKKCSRL